MSWHYTWLQGLIPDIVARQIYPVDKTNVDILRFLHFLAIAWFVRLAIPPNAPYLRWRVLEPLRRCGEHSLQIFCVGTFLALSAQIVDAHFDGSLLSQLVVSISGIVIMTAFAYAATWFKVESDVRAH